MWDIFSFLTDGSRGDEIRVTKKLFERTHALRARAPFRDSQHVHDFATEVVSLVCEDLEVMLSEPVILLLHDTIVNLLSEDHFIVNYLAPIEMANLGHEIGKLGVREGSRVREGLKRHVRLVENQSVLIPLVRKRLLMLFSGLLQRMPLSAFADLEDDGSVQETGMVLPEARLFDLIDDLGMTLDKVIGTMWADEVEDADLFAPLRGRLIDNIDAASGIAPQDRQSTKKARLMPSEYNAESNEELCDTYLTHTAFLPFFYAHVPFAIPFPARFEHTHVIGGTGHGKTQLLQYLIVSDLVKACDDGRSLVVVDSQGDLIRSIAHLDVFDEDGALADRLVLIDPTDVEHPVALNMFDFNRKLLDDSTPKDRELLLNASIEAYEYFFGTLLGAELTQRQGVMFRFLARLLLEIPNATIHTLRDLMENGERYRMYMERLPHTARGFFETRFFDRSFSETKKQILARLWGVLGNATLERMFSHSENKIDLGALMQEGKIVLVNTAKDFLGHEGANLFGRFMITMLTQATLQRAAIASKDRNPTFVYVDEAADYIDDNIGRLLTQARKQKVGLTLAHQNLDQLPPELRSVMMANTTIKFAGGVSSKDATALDGEFRVSSKFLLAQRKQKHYSEFACFVKNETQRALSVRIPLGVLEGLDTMSRDSYDTMIDQNRALYTAPPEYPKYEEVRARRAPVEKPSKVKVAEEVVDAVFVEPAVVRSEAVDTPAPYLPKAPARKVAIVPPIARNPQGGGQKHRYLQELVKTLGEERGFRAQIEQELADGSGRVDVILSRGKRRIACEISVTTSRDHELLNVEKCLAAGFDEVMLISHNERHLKSLTTFVGNSLAEKDRTKVRYLLPDMIVGFLGDGHAAMQSEQVVRGYKVKVVAERDQFDGELRKAAIAEVMAKAVAGV